jgi:peptidase M48-like protein
MPDSVVYRVLLVLILSELLHAASQFPNESVIADAEVDVGPRSFASYPINIPVQLRNGRVAGSVYASGGPANDIRVMILTESDFVALGQNRSITPLYDSGRRRSIVLSVSITESGNYYLVIDNRFTSLSPKRVTPDIRLVYDAVDIEGEKKAQEKQADRRRRAGLILGKLTESLEKMEEEWGTRQVSPPLNLAIQNDPKINAFAIWQAKTILLQRGFIDFAESNPSKKDDILAAALGHELAHIFYRHSSGNESAEIAQSVIPSSASAISVHPLVRVLVGAIAYDQNRRYDRTQEQEADLLSIRLACDAGYDPQAVLLMMKRFKEQNLLGVSFFQTHPSPAQRESYLRSQIAECEIKPKPSTRD